MDRLTERTQLGSLIQKGNVSTRMMIDKLGEIEDLEEFIQSHSDVTAISILRGYASNYKGYEERLLNS